MSEESYTLANTRLLRGLDLIPEPNAVTRESYGNREKIGEISYASEDD